MNHETAGLALSEARTELEATVRARAALQDKARYFLTVFGAALALAFPKAETSAAFMILSAGLVASALLMIWFTLRAANYVETGVGVSQTLKEDFQEADTIHFQMGLADIYSQAAAANRRTLMRMAFWFNFSMAAAFLSCLCGLCFSARW